MNTKTLTYVNIALIVAVVILFGMQVSNGCCKKEETKETPVVAQIVEQQKIVSVPVGAIKVAYVNSDTVAKYYQFSKDITSKLKEKQASAQYKLKSLYAKYEKERADFEKQAPIMSQSEMQRKAQEIGLMEQDIMQKEQKLSAKLSETEMKVTNDYVYQTNDFMQEIGEGLGYDYVMSYRIGGPMLYANPSLDITTEVVEKLNEVYKKSKETKQPSK